MTSHRMHSKKAFIGDVMTILIFTFIMGLTIMVGYLLLSSWNTQVQASDSMGTIAQDLTQDQTTKYPGLWDGLFGVIFIGMSLASAISAYFIDTHPIVFALCLVILAVFIIVGAVLSNTYNAIETSGIFASFASSFRLMHYVLNNLGMYAAVEGFLIMIALFTKARQ
jgi:hypothetical protein